MLIFFLVLLVGLVMFWTLAGPSRSRRTGRRVNDAPPPRTTVAPDDDEEFLRRLGDRLRRPDGD